MAGIYLHIPFCRKACHYCNFHFSTSLGSKASMVEAIARELDSRSSYVKNQTIETIYFGGGTPSILAEQEIIILLNAIHDNYSVSRNCEITLEANPDDLDQHSLEQIYRAGINRLSVGVQSFNEEVLKYMNRSHTSKQSVEVLDYINEGPFTNYSVDLIFGHHHSSIPLIENEINQLAKYQVPHISCYSLTIEPNTAFGRWHHSKKIDSIEDGKASSEFLYIKNSLEERDYLHYEISNYAMIGSESIHNKNYWLKKSYLGVGPGAHSYNGSTRRWNVSNNAKYLKAMQDDGIFYTEEVLSDQDRYNEYVMVRLRINEGCRTEELVNIGSEYADHFHTSIQEYIKTGMVVENKGAYRLSTEGMLIADTITSDIFISNS